MSEHLDTSCAEKLRVLADPTRLSVMELLLSGPRRVGEINEILGLEQSLLSHHLRVLRDHGFVVTERDGKGIRYHLSPEFRSPEGDTLNLGCCAISFERPVTTLAAVSGISEGADPGGS